MKVVLITVFLITFHEALAAPAARNENADTDDKIEQELIRHHHSLTPGLQRHPDNEEQEADSVDIVLPHDNNGEDSDVDLFDDESLYDFTVADVLADIIYELKKNPVLLEQLIESERQKVQHRLEEMSSASKNSNGDDLAEFQKSAKQLNDSPMQVEKKAGRSTMEDMSGHLENKRADEVIDGNYVRNDVSEEVQDLENFLNPPLEEGSNEIQLKANRPTITDKEMRSNVGNIGNTEHGNSYDMYNWIRALPKSPVQTIPVNKIMADKQKSNEPNTLQTSKAE